MPLFYFTYRWRLWNRRRLWDALSKKTHKQLADLRKAKEHVNANGLDHWLDGEYQEYRAYVDSLQTGHLLKLAERFDISPPPILPEPEDSSDRDPASPWEQSHFDYGYYLTPKGRSDLRALIRNEKNQRIESALKWIPLVTAITGLLGVVIGLLALLLR